MARGHYTVQKGSPFARCKPWIVAFAVLGILALVQASILMTPYLMEDDRPTPTFDALENHPESSNISTVITETYPSDTGSTPKSTTSFDDTDVHTTAASTMHTNRHSDGEFDILVLGKWNTSLDFENSTKAMDSSNSTESTTVLTETTETEDSEIVVS
ncbi:uncharacterized protein LOC120350202 [Nilaparvata lugens]|uniref:uncharacterized protein LOC120350202 n=1 Tax=Nilaparvata lugens TaxID=108931 RepID=UPI00193E2964|nr:uncharacterized protein LOC120350202 [Nilaparvata lugens]